jgi:very-short-patch-repair endonuclease
MTKHYNKKTEQEKRRSLRKNMTYCEKIVWSNLRKRQLGYRFLSQYSVDHFVIDFYCPELKLAVEVDGASHNDPERQKNDISRQKYLEAFNIKFVRIKDEDLFGNPNNEFMKIENAIKLLEKIPK